MTPADRRPGNGDPGSGSGSGSGRGAGRSGDRDPERKPRGMERLADLLPHTARQYGLEEQLEQARVASAWLAVIAERIPQAAGACRLIGLDQDVATIEADEAIVAQEVRLRSLELLAALRATARTPIRQLRVTTRHV